MNRNKATHSGSCQWCGREQKLPGGKLSKHGYTVEWGFFNGVCKGEGHDPFEVSCDLVKKAIEWAKAEKKGLIDECAKLRASKSTTLQVYWYRSSRFGGRDYGYRWITVTIQSEQKGNDEYRWTEFFYMDPDGQKQEAVHFYDGVKTMEAAVAKLNDARAKAHEQTIKQIDEYITYQTKRVENWKPAPLKEIK